MSKKLIVVVDAQNDFMKSNGALYVPDSEQVIDNINGFLRNLNPTEVDTVLFTFDTHDAKVYPDSEEGKMFPPHCIQGTRGHALAVDASLVPDSITIATLTKGVFNMWAEDQTLVFLPKNPRDNQYLPREVFFQEAYRAGIEEVLVVGVATNFCVKWAVDGLVSHGFKVGVFKELVRGIDTGNGEKDTNPIFVFENEISQGKVKII